jgi:hypothetical protein
MNIRKSFLVLVAGLLTTASAFAQQLPINSLNQQGIQVGNIRYPTYAAISTGLVPAASATDIFCINASPSKNVYITNIGFSGTAGTAATVHLAFLRRVSLDTGGTVATGTAAPVGYSESSISAATATLTAYTANPTINDSSPTYMRTGVLGIPTSAAAIAQSVQWTFGTVAGQFNTEFTLVKGSTQQACLNLQATTITTGYLDIWIEWQEY